MEILSQKACILPKSLSLSILRKIERRSKRFERERERKVLKNLSGSTSAADFSLRPKALLFLIFFSF